MVKHDVWSEAAAYEPYVGRWSRLVAREFLGWLAVPEGSGWLEVGSGTGALSRTILAAAAPRSLAAMDRSAAYVAYARRALEDPRSCFQVGDAVALPFRSGAFDVAVSGLMLNFIPGAAAAIREMRRVTRAGGLVAAYVWDYAGEMQLMRRFWDAAAALDEGARQLDEGRRFPLCRPDALAGAFSEADLDGVGTRAIDVPTVFRDFDDYWSPFLGGQGPAPAYAMSLDEERRGRLRELIRQDLPFRPDGSIRLVARAWAVRGSVGTSRGAG
jgi:SAM-dependent methyltransferase